MFGTNVQSHVPIKLKKLLSARNGQHSPSSPNLTLHHLAICPPKSPTTQQKRTSFLPPPKIFTFFTDYQSTQPVTPFPLRPGRETYLARWPRDSDTIRSPHDQTLRTSPHQTPSSAATNGRVGNAWQRDSKRELGQSEHGSSLWTSFQTYEVYIYTCVHI